MMENIIIRINSLVAKLMKPIRAKKIGPEIVRACD